jgi:hypothetical protein
MMVSVVVTKPVSPRFLEVGSLMRIFERRLLF